MNLNQLNEEFKPALTTAANELNNSLPMSKPQIRAAFNDDELKKVHKMILDVNSATTDNNKVIKVQEHAKTALGLLKTLGVGI